MIEGPLQTLPMNTPRWAFMAEVGGTDVMIAASKSPSKAAIRKAKEIAAGPMLAEACRKWLKHYDAFVKQKHLGDEPGIAEMRAILDEIK